MNLFELFAKLSIDTTSYDKGISDAIEKGKGLQKSFEQISISSETYNNKLKVLEAQHESAKKEVEELTTAFNKAAKEKGVDSQEAQELAQKLKEAEQKADGLQREIDDLSRSTSRGADEFENFSNKLKTGLKTAAKIGGTAILAISAAIGKLASMSINAYAEQEQLIGGIETLFGAGGKSVEEYADSVGKSVDEVQSEYDKLIRSQEAVIRNANDAYKTAGIDANEYMDTAVKMSSTLIQSLGGDTEEAAKYVDMAITDMSDNINKLGTDADMVKQAYSSFARQQYQLLDNLALGYQGTKSEMERLLADAEKISGIKYDISSYADVVQAIHVIQTEMGITGTTMEEGMKTISGSINMTKAAWQNLVTGFSDSNADIGQLIDNFIESAKGAASNIIPILGQALSGIGELISELAPVIAEELPGLIEQLVPPLISAAADLIGELAASLPELLATLWSAITDAVDELGKTLAEKFPAFSGLFENLSIVVNAVVAAFIAFKAATAISGIIQTLIPVVKSLTTETELLNTAMKGNIIILIVSLVASLVTALITLWNTNEDFRNAVISIWENIKNTFIAVVDAIKSVFSGIKDFFSQAVEDIKSVFSGIGDWFSDRWNDIKEAFSLVTSFFSETFTEAKEGIKTAFSNVGSWFSEKWEEIKSVFSTAQEIFKEVGKEILQGIWNGISDKIEWLKKQVGGVVEKIKSWFTGKEAFDVHSPSKWAQQQGEYVMQGLGDGFTNGASYAIKRAETAANKIKNNLSSKISKLNQELEQLELKEQNRATQKEIDAYEEKLSSAQNKLNNAELKDRQAVLDEIDKIQSEWNEKQLKKQEDAQKEQLKSQIDALEDMQSEYEKAYNDAIDTITSKQTSLSDKIKGFGDLFRTVDTKGKSMLELEDIQEDIDAIQRYGENLEALKEKNISSSLMDEILSFSVEDATAYTEKLLNMTDEALDEYLSKWEQKQTLAANIASNFYAKDIEDLQSQFEFNMPEVETVDVIGEIGQITQEDIQSAFTGASEFVAGTFANIQQSIVTPFAEIGTDFYNIWQNISNEIKTDEAFNWGADLVQKFISGINSKAGELYERVQSIAMMIQNNLGFSEPKEGPLSNFHTYAPDMMQLFAQGIKDNEGLIKEQLNKSFDFGANNVGYPQSLAGISSAQYINTLSQANKQQSIGGEYVINLMMPDGTKLASYLLPNLINISNANGKPIAMPT